MEQLTTSVKRRIELQRDVVKGLKASLETTESKLLITLEKQLDYLLDKLTRCALDDKEMYMVKNIGDMIIQIRKLTVKDEDTTIVNNNLNVSVEDLKQIAKGD